MTETQKRKKRLFHRKFARSKKPEENRDAIGEIVYAIVKSGGYINDVHKKTLKEMGFML